jgi:hypothetical protein
MAFDQAGLQTWVNTLGLSDADKTVVLAALGKDAILPKVGESILAQGEFTRRMQDLQSKERTLEDQYKARIAEEEKKTTDFVNATGTWKTEKEALANDAIAKREAAEAALNRVKTEIQSLATDYGIPAERIPKFDVTTPTNSTPTHNDLPNRDLEGKFVTKEYMKGLEGSYVKLPAIITRLDREYERLFGRDAPLVDWEKVIDDAGKNKRTLLQQFETEYKVPERRAAIAKEQHDKEIADAEARGAESARTKLLADNPGLATNTRRENGEGSPILAQARAQATERAKANNTPAPVDESRGVAAAVNAFRQGKYKAA